MAIVTIGGNIGSGKTTLAVRLERALGYEGLYTGHIFREMAREEGVAIEKFYAELKSDPELERSIDEEQARKMQKKTDLVIQGRIGWFFAKQSPSPAFNIFLSVDPKIGAERSGRRKENAGKSIGEMVKMNAMREAEERERYRALYGIENFQDPKHYDFVLDTSRLTEEAAFKKVLEKIKERLDADV